MEKKVMVRLCAKILTETDLYDTDMEGRNLIEISLGFVESLHYRF